jgi:hypothetical protein
MEDINDINTVQDLIRINKMRPATTKELVRELVEPIFQETPGIGMECIDTLIMGMIELHETMIDTMQENDAGQEQINSWTIDLSKLHIIQELLDSIRI